MEGLNSKSKKSKAHLPLDFPKGQPEIQITDYLTSKSLQPVFDVHPETTIHNSSSYCLKESLQSKDIKEATLKWKRESLQKTKEEFKESEELWLKKQNEFKQMFKTFDYFVKANAEKRLRMRQKIDQELLVQKQREEDMEQLKINYGNLLKIKSIMENQLKSYKIYEDYLLDVANISHFKNAGDIIKRFEDLISVKQSLGDKLNNIYSNLKQCENNLNNFIKENELKLLGLTNTLAQTRERYGQVLERAFLWETVVERIQNYCIDRRTEFIQLKYALWSFYLKLSSRTGKSKIKKDNWIGQLDYIKNKLNSLDKVKVMLEEHTKKNYFI